MYNLLLHFVAQHLYINLFVAQFMSIVVLAAFHSLLA